MSGPQSCETCEAAGTLYDASDFTGDARICAPCAEAAMAHGHAHVHDEPEDCTVTLPALGAGGQPLTVTCEA